mgnify:CR=1 FL=1
MEVERPETPLSLKITGWVVAALLALMVFRSVIGVIRFVFTIAVLVALAATAAFVTRQVKKN